MGKAVPQAPNLIMHVDMLIGHVVVFREAQGQLYLTHVRQNFHKTLNIMPAGSTIHFSLHHSPFIICISSRKLDLSCLHLYTCIVRIDLNGNKGDGGAIIVHLTSLYQLLATGF